MPRNQVIYNQVGVFAGPAPSSGYHFISSDGVLNNQLSSFNLVFPLNRVTSVSYSIQTQRSDISHLGNLGTLKRPILEYTDVNLNINYLMMGLVNEARIGMHMNIPSGNPITGEFAYGSGRVCPILGYYSRDYSRTTDPDSFNWPMKEYRDARNIFVVIKRDSSDFNALTGDYNNPIDYDGVTFPMGFGDCYLNSYSMSAGVKTLPTVSVNYGCNNVAVYDTTTDNGLPSISTDEYEMNSGLKFNIPANFQGTGLPTALLPTDISLSIKQRSNNSEDLDDNFVDFTDIKIQDFSFSFDLKRKPLYALGHKYPLDRRPTFPITCELNFDSIVGDPKAGSMTSLLKRDEEYDIQIKMDYQQGNQYFSGTSIQYDWIGAKFNSFNSSMSIQERKAAAFSFSTEMDPTDTTKGFFISGYLSMLSTVTTTDYLADNFFAGPLGRFLTEDEEQFLLSYPAFGLTY